MKAIRSIEITFPTEVELPPGLEQVLDSLTEMVCKAWEADNPGFLMWAAGHGSKVLWREPEEPLHDSSVFNIEVATREATAQEIAQGRALPKP